MRVLLLHLVFTLPGELRTSPGVPAHFDNRNMTLLQTLDLTVHDLDRFFNEVQFVVNLDFILWFFNEVQFVVNLDFILWYSKRFISHAFLQLRDVKCCMDSTQML
nr:hypothetical protein [Tanacetum cinerariifolium]